jgi:aquaporin NIP
MSANANMKRYIAEVIGTFALVFAGTGAIIINDVSGGVVSHVGIALSFGLVVMAMIYTFGDVSGAHLNPAVTIGFVTSRRMHAAEGACYILSQITGAIAASGVLRLLFPTHPTLGITLPAGSAVQSFGLEFLLTALLMLVVLNVSVGAKEKGITAGIAIGGVIALEAIFAGPICGASMESRALPRACACHGQFQFSVGLHLGSGHRSTRRGAALHLRSRAGVLRQSHCSN